MAKGGSGFSGNRGGGEFSAKAISDRVSELNFKPMGKLPELSGSEKQVKWANDIRTEILKELSEYAGYYTNDGKYDTNRYFNNVAKGKDEIVRDIQRRFESLTRHFDNPNVSPYSQMSTSELNGLRRKRLDESIDPYKELSERIQRLGKIASEKSAKWWIDHRKQGGIGSIYDMERYIDGKRKNYD